MSVFNCPIFDVDTNSAACAKLMELKWVGKPVEVRKGCQACMESSKCPFVNMVFMNRNRDKHNQIELNGKLPRELLERIQPIVVQDQHLNKHGVSVGERDRILSANSRIDALIGRAPSADAAPRRRSSPKPVAKPATSTDKAAATGDLGAAISQAA